MLTAIYNYPENGFHPILELEEGKEYRVKNVSMGGSFTYIELEGYEGSYNSVNFDFYKDGIPHDIFRDPNYNLYIGRRAKDV